MSFQPASVIPASHTVLDLTCITADRQLASRGAGLVKAEQSAALPLDASISNF